jgi:hypothetical protein
MMSEKINIIENLMNHPFYAITNKWLTEGGMDSNSVMNKMETSITWNLTADDGISLFIQIYDAGDEGVFIRLSSAISNLIPSTESNCMKWMLNHHLDSPYPFRLCVDNENAVLLESRAPADGITPVLYDYLLYEMIGQSNRILRELSLKFQMRPFLENLEKNDQQKKNTAYN